MKFQKPASDLAFLTVIWVIYAGFILFWIDVPERQLSWFGGLMVIAVIASIGIWLGIRRAGYAFAAVNLVASTLCMMLMLGLLPIQRSVTWKLVATTAVPLYCAFVAIRWARTIADESR